MTICTKNKRHLFSSVGADSISARMVLNDADNMILDTLKEMFDNFNNITLDKYAIMLNRIHTIIIISCDNGDVGADIVQSFKRYSTVRYIEGVKSGVYPKFDKHIMATLFPRPHHPQQRNIPKNLPLHRKQPNNVVWRVLLHNIVYKPQLPPRRRPPCT